MKYMWIALTVVLAGCSSMPTANNSPAEWRDYGEKTAIHGKRLLTEDAISINDDEQYAAYVEGYESGQKTYCSKNAFELGRSGQLYRGICDEMDPTFRENYNTGVRVEQSHRPLAYSSKP